MISQSAIKTYVFTPKTAQVLPYNLASMGYRVASATLKGTSRHYIGKKPTLKCPPTGMSVPDDQHNSAVSTQSAKTVPYRAIRTLGVTCHRLQSIER